MRRPVDVISTVPLSATAQLLLPGTEAVAVPVQLIVPLLPSVACAEPVPDIGTLPLQVAANAPDTEVAVRLVIVHEKPPHEPCCADIDCVDANVPMRRFVLSNDVVIAEVAEGDVAMPPHAAAASSAASEAAEKSVERMGKTLACL